MSELAMRVGRDFLGLLMPLTMLGIGLSIIVTSRQIGDDMNDLRDKMPVRFGSEQRAAYGCGMAFFGSFLALIGLAVLVQAIVAIAGGA